MMAMACVAPRQLLRQFGTPVLGLIETWPSKTPEPVPSAPAKMLVRSVVSALTSERCVPLLLTPGMIVFDIGPLTLPVASSTWAIPLWAARLTVRKLPPITIELARGPTSSALTVLGWPLGLVIAGRQPARNTGAPEAGIVYDAALGLGFVNAPPTYNSVLVAASERTWLSTFGAQPLIRLAPVVVRL